MLPSIRQAKSGIITIANVFG